jgi:LAO/AO transport system kinase
MKAGILELPDVFVVNKADLGAVARRTASELEAGLGLGEREASGWTPPVVLVSARDGVGIQALVDTLEAHRAHLVASRELASRRKQGADVWVLETLERRYGSYGLERLGARPGLEKRLQGDASPSPFARVLALGREIEEALAKPRP